MESKPGFGGALAHGACCGLPLLFFLVLKFPLLLLYGGGVIVFGGLFGVSVLGLRRGRKRRERYQTLVQIRQERNLASPGESFRVPAGGLSDSSGFWVPSSEEGGSVNSMKVLR